MWQTDGATPLYIASSKGLVECVLALLSRGAAINKAKVGIAFPTVSHCVDAHRCVPCAVASQANGATPLVVASGNGHLECIRALLTWSAAINQATVGYSCPTALYGLGLCGSREFLGACVCRGCIVRSCDVLCLSAGEACRDV